MNFNRMTPLFLSVVCLSGCGPRLDISTEEVRVEFEDRLHIGDSASRIEGYFAERGLEATFDAYASRYQSTIRQPDSNFHAISIYVNVDGNKRYLNVEAHDSYTLWLVAT